MLSDWVGVDLASRGVWAPDDLVVVASRLRRFGGGSEGVGPATAPSPVVEALAWWERAREDEGAGRREWRGTAWALQRAATLALRRQVAELSPLGLDEEVDQRPFSNDPEALMRAARAGYPRWSRRSREEIRRRLATGVGADAPRHCLDPRALLAAHMAHCRRCRPGRDWEEHLEGLAEDCYGYDLVDLVAGGVDLRRLAHGRPDEPLPDVWVRPLTRPRDLFPPSRDLAVVQAEVERFHSGLRVLRAVPAAELSGPDREVRVYGRLFAVRKEVVRYARAGGTTGDEADGDDIGEVDEGSWVEMERKEKVRVCWNARPVMNKGFARVAFQYPDVSFSFSAAQEGSWLWSADVSDFYCGIAIDRESRRLCSVAMPARGRYQAYEYTGLAFGLSQAPLIACLVSGELGRAAGADQWYIDDVVGAEQSRAAAASRMADLLEWVGRLGFCAKPAKVSFPAQEVRALGWQVTTAARLELALPETKWVALRAGLGELQAAWVLGTGEVDIDTVRRVAGQADHVSQVLLPRLRGTARAWLRFAHGDAAWREEALARLHEWLAVEAPVRRSWQGRVWGRSRWDVWTDGSDEGVGGWVARDGGVEELAWSVALVGDEWKGSSSALREMVGLAVAVDCLGGGWRGWADPDLVVWHADALAALCIFDSGSSMCPITAAWVRRVRAATHGGEVVWLPHFVPRERNVRADELSRPSALTLPSGSVRSACRRGRVEWSGAIEWCESPAEDGRGGDGRA